MMTACPDRWLPLQALLDGELDGVNSAALENHLATCPGCSAEFDDMINLRAVLAAGTLGYAAPMGLRDRVAAAAAIAVRPDKPIATRRGPRWLGSSLAGALAASLLLVVAAPQLFSRGLQGELVGGHIRSLQAGHLIDVATSDRHVVKPWFNGRIDFSPPVADLIGRGFPLVGGRLDYIDGGPVAALVYRRRLHTINLYIRRAPALGAAAAVETHRDSYNLVGWTSDGLQFWAVSDIEPNELTNFEAAFRATTHR